MHAYREGTNALLSSFRLSPLAQLYRFEIRPRTWLLAPLERKKEGPGQISLLVLDGGCFSPHVGSVGLEVKRLHTKKPCSKRGDRLNRYCLKTFVGQNLTALGTCIM